jgi:hypothetical protein
VYTQEVNFPVGTWLSLVEHSLGVRGVGSSNLPVPTITPTINAIPPVARFASVDSFVLAALAADPLGLQQHQRQGQTGVNPAVAMPAAYRILQQQKPLEVLDAKTG